MSSKRETCSSSSKTAKKSASPPGQSPSPKKSHPKPKPAYKGAKSSAVTEPTKDTSANNPAVADAVQGLLDLRGDAEVMSTDGLEIESSEAEKEVGKSGKRKRKGDESEDEEKDEDSSGTSSDLSDDEDDEGAFRHITSGYLIEAWYRSCL
jgi:hypothetical protein